MMIIAVQMNSSDHPHIFFDLDHTLWDFEANAEATLRELYDYYDIVNRTDSSVDVFIQTYSRVNNRYWALYRKQQVSKADLRVQRFTDTFAEVGIERADIPKGIWEHYIEICPTKTQLMAGAKETLDYLSQNHKLHLITNGFEETQHRKLKNTKLEQYFQSLTISEVVGSQKPSPYIFKQALLNAGLTAEESTYVGDNFEADVQGGINAGWQVFWLNETNSHPDFTHPKLVRIKKLLELKKHF
ncbi:MAG: YjjG family noncanonical pyrimidine nucleotidase [Bacteroidia bacterium]